MNTKILNIIIGIALLMIVIGVGMIVLENLSIAVENNIISVNCCNNQTCSDTYYKPSDNTCHLSLCEQSLFNNKSDCVYAGKNYNINTAESLQ